MRVRLLRQSEPAGRWPVDSARDRDLHGAANAALWMCVDILSLSLPFIGPGAGGAALSYAIVGGGSNAVAFTYNLSRTGSNASALLGYLASLRMMLSSATSNGEDSEDYGDMAFGLSKHQTNGSYTLLENFADKINAQTYFNTKYRNSFPTEHILEEILFGARSIHVNLDGLASSMDDIPHIVQLGSRGLNFRPPQGGGNITNWEIWRIFQDPELLLKAKFYLNNQIKVFQ